MSCVCSRGRCVRVRVRCGSCRSCGSLLGRLYRGIRSVQLTLDVRRSRVIVRISPFLITFPFPTTFTLPPSSRCHQVRWQASKRGRMCRRRSIREACEAQHANRFSLYPAAVAAFSVAAQITPQCSVQIRKLDAWPTGEEVSEWTEWF